MRIDLRSKTKQKNTYQFIAKFPTMLLNFRRVDDRMDINTIN